jgi:hypothetical protein
MVRDTAEELFLNSLPLEFTSHLLTPPSSAIWLSIALDMQAMHLFAVANCLSSHLVLLAVWFRGGSCPVPRARLLDPIGGCDVQQNDLALASLRHLDFHASALALA